MTAPVPFLDLGRLHDRIRSELDAAMDEVVRTSGFIGSATCARFEEEFAAASGLRGAVGCGSGTDALVLALRALAIGPGDEVVVPAMTFVATAEAVVHVGATPVLGDVDPITLLLTPQSVAEVRTERTRAVLPVHLYGHVVPLTTIDEWRASDLVVVEDAAQAHLATWNGRPVGTAGHAAAFSFYPGKNLGALGDAGAVLSNDEGLLSRVRSLGDHGSSTKYQHDEVGWCSRLDGLQAALLRVKLRHLAHWTKARQQLAERYAERLGEVLVPWEPGAVHHLLVMRASERDRFCGALADAGIRTGQHYPVALSDQPALARWAQPCPAAEVAAAEVVSLPMDPLMTTDEVDRVADTVLLALGR
jgi:dTDP-4-amino-4,6-dideoxygalactose transaminase